MAELLRLNASVEAELRLMQVSRARAEESVAHLATLYAAASSLSQGIQRRNVPGAINDIFINLIGCEALATFQVAEGARELTLLASIGIDPAPYQVVPFGVGRIGRAAQTGELYLAERADITPTDPTACIPLKFDGSVVGVIAIFRLLPQKAAFEPVDLDLFALLPNLAAAALRCSTPESGTR
jgi:GAF domain-containing protein